MFVDIYEQAREALDAGLDQIGGPGLRKAFEFLVKDYAKSKAQSAEEKEKIDKSFAGNVVNDVIKDSRIVNVSKRAIWLGNDETHYLRKWTDHDVDDLIILIQLTMHWMEIEKLSDDYLKQMPEGETTSEASP